MAPADLPFFIALMEHLAHHGVACPTPVRARDGDALRELCGRPAAIVTFLDGMWPRRIEPFHCAGARRRAGAAASRRRLVRDDPAQRSRRSPAGGGSTRPARARADEVQPGLADELGAELDALEAAWPRDLPSGVIHADLFPDNVFFRDRELSGLIDFYFACTDFLAYDLAICLNAWCFEPDGSFNVTKARLLVDGYRAARPLGAGRARGAAAAGARQRAALPADPALRLAEPDRGRPGAAEGPARISAQAALSPRHRRPRRLWHRCLSRLDVEIFTDGACSGNPGPGGWGAILRYARRSRRN